MAGSFTPACCLFQREISSCPLAAQWLGVEWVRAGLVTGLLLRAWGRLLGWGTGGGTEEVWG